MATTAFDLVTPSATFFSGQAEMIVCKTVEGEIAFLADHEAYIGALDPCLVRVVGPEGTEGSEFRVAVHSTHSISCTAQLRGWYILLVTVARYNSPGGRGGQAAPPSEVPVSVQPDALGSAA